MSSLIEAVVTSNNVPLAKFRLTQKLKRSINDQNEVAVCLSAIGEATQKVMEKNQQSTAVSRVANNVKQNIVQFLRFVGSFQTQKDSDCSDGACGAVNIGIRG